MLSKKHFKLIFVNPHKRVILTIFDPEVPYKSQMRLKALLYLISITNIDNAYWAYLLQVLSHKLRKLEWDMIYLSIFICFEIILLRYTNSLFIDNIDFKLKKWSSTSLQSLYEFMIYTSSHRSCQIFTKLVYNSGLHRICKRKIMI